MKTVKLLRTKRYNHEGTTYELGRKYPVKDALGKTLLAQIDDSGLPYFIETSADADAVQRDAEIKAAESKSAGAKVEPETKAGEAGTLEGDGVEV